MMNEINENSVTKQDSAQHGDCNNINTNTHCIYSATKHSCSFKYLC